MSSTTYPALTGRARALTFVAGYLIVVISVAHIAYFSMETADYWDGWIAGDIRFTDAVPADVLEAFWVLPGGFGLPTIALGLMAIDYARHRRVVPRSVAIVFLAWTLLASFLMLASGFPLGIVPAVMLLAAHNMARRGTPPRAQHGGDRNQPQPPTRQPGANTGDPHIQRSEY